LANYILTPRVLGSILAVANDPRRTGLSLRLQRTVTHSGEGLRWDRGELLQMLDMPIVKKQPAWDPSPRKREGTGVKGLGRYVAGGGGGLREVDGMED
jgi:hypothetical protein